MMWIPDDAELDAIARTVDVPTPPHDRIEQMRTSVLARADGATQLRRRSPAPLIATVSAMFAVAAAVLLWLVVRPGPIESKETIVPFGAATFHREAPWPDYVVRVAEGHVSIAVAPLSADEHFRARTDDAELGTRDGTFVVGVRAGRLQSVAVTHGRVELHTLGAVIVLAAGQVWPPVQVVERETIVPAPSQPPTASPSGETTTPHGPHQIQAPEVATTNRITDRRPSRSAVPAKRPAVTETRESVANELPTTTSSETDRTEHLQRPEPGPLSPTAPAASPGELAFRDGVSALRRGDARAATKHFETACTALHGEALAEDACFWLGAAAKRAGEQSLAKRALASFVQQFPTSSRAGEASALLGWMLYDAGDLAAAQPLFERAAKDRVPRVRESAERGLEAIKRLRGSP